jgi:GWxTD domain-containing protein
MIVVTAFLLTLGASTSDSWLARVGPGMSSAERNAYRRLASDAEKRGFQRAFWNGKTISETEYFERVAYADRMFGSGMEGSGANTDQGRMYIASGPPSSIQRLPSSRIFVACEVWHYASLPGTGYRSRLQFLFFRKAAGGDLRLYWPGLHSIRDLLLPQPGTRSMFPVNDLVTPNDIRDRLRYSPSEEEVLDAASGVARGITGSGNSEILSRAVSISAMVHGGENRAPRTEVETRFTAEVQSPIEIRSLHFWVDGVPVTDIQVRAPAAVQITMTVEDSAKRTVVERAMVPLGWKSPRAVLYSQRFFLAPGRYHLVADVDGTTVRRSLQVSTGKSLTGEALEESPGEYRISLLPDPRTADAKAIAASRLR